MARARARTLIALTLGILAMPARPVTGQQFTVSIDTAALRPRELRLLVDRVARSTVTFAAEEFGLYVVGPLEDAGRLKLARHRGIRGVAPLAACEPRPRPPRPEAEQWLPTSDVKPTMDLTVHPALTRAAVEAIARRHGAEVVSSAPCGAFGLKSLTHPENLSALADALKREPGVLDARPAFLSSDRP